MSAALLKSMIDEIRLHGFESVFRRYYGIYRGTVISNADKEGRGLIKVQVPGIFGEKTLPTSARPRNFRDAGKSKGEFFPPNVGDFVWIEFEAGDSRFPVYSGGWYAAGQLPEEMAYEGGVPTKRGYVNKYGHTWIFDETDGKEKFVLTTPAGNFFVLDDTDDSHGVFLIHSSGAQLQIDNEGNLKLFSGDESGAGANFINMSAETGEVTVTTQTGAYVALGEDIKVGDSSGEQWLSIGSDGITLNAGADILLNGNVLGGSFSSIDLVDATQTGLKVANGKFAVGSDAVELVDTIIKMIDALTDGSPLVTTGTGPSSGLLPPALTQLLLLKTLLEVVKL